MGKTTGVVRQPYPEQRKHRRFALRYPVQLKFSSGTAVSELQATSRNVSIGGLLLEVPSPVLKHSPVTFTMTVQGGSVVHPVELVGEGKVVRIEPQGSGLGFAIAVECTRPIAQMADYMSPSRG
ncbi:MAG: PilZ domain-containing protein [Acidobacteriia bacterium]|nr:PilZ domain-containing protein [Terriglobia bacterium]